MITSIFRKHLLFLFGTILLSVLNAQASFVPIYTDHSNGLLWSKTLPGVYSNGCRDLNYDYRRCRNHPGMGCPGLIDPNKCTVEILPGGERIVKTEDSAAAIACQNVGARLPTMPEFESLLKKFDHVIAPDYLGEWIRPKLTDSGKTQMETVFGDTGWFWMSSIIAPINAPMFNDKSGYFNGLTGYLSRTSRSSNHLQVRCVVSTQ